MKPLFSSKIQLKFSFWLLRAMLEAGGADSIDPIPIVRIYAGGRNGIQYRAISTSISQLKRDFDCQGLGHDFNHEVKYNDDVRKLKWNPSDLVDWLLSGDIHIVCTHMHQGLPHWRVADVLDALKRLKDHNGFPMGNSLTCPVFLQHKFDYLASLPKFMTCPTLPIKFGRLTSNHLRDLEWFMQGHDEGRGWVVKMPFVTNCEGLQYCQSPERTIKMIEHTIERFHDRVPYLMIQPCLANKKEYKVVVLNGEAKYLLSSSGVRKVKGRLVATKSCSFPLTCFLPGHAFSGGAHLSLKKFAESAVKLQNKRNSSSS